MLQKIPERGNDDMKAHFARLVPSLLTKTILPLAGKPGESVSSRVMADDSVLDVTGRLINILIRPLDVGQQTFIAGQIFSLFRGQPCEYITAADREKVAERFRPFQMDSEKEHAGCVIIFAYVLAALRREVWTAIQNYGRYPGG